MTIYEQNREYVLRGLALREVKRNEEAARQTAAAKDAALDAAERDLHRDINFQSRWNDIEKTVTQRAERRDKELAERKAAHHARSKKQDENLNTYLLRMSIPLIIASILTILFTFDAVSLWVNLTGIALCGAYAIYNFVAYATRNRQAYKQKMS